MEEIVKSCLYPVMDTPDHKRLIQRSFHAHLANSLKSASL